MRSSLGLLLYGLAPGAFGEFETGYFETLLIGKPVAKAEL
jgi:hypothetical protein